MPPRVELVYFEGCPHTNVARIRLREAMSMVGLTPTWAEWDTGLDPTPESYRRFGSPTILVDGRDISGAPEVNGTGCAVGGAPAVATIVVALERGRE